MLRGAAARFHTQFPHLCTSFERALPFQELDGLSSQQQLAKDLRECGHDHRAAEVFLQDFCHVSRAAGGFQTRHGS
jgi:tellurite resistance protein